MNSEMMIRYLLAIPCLSVVVAGIGLDSAEASSVLLSYQSANGAAVSPSGEASGVTGASLVRGAGIEENTGSTFNSRGWDQPDAAAALAGGDFLEWGFESTGPVDLESLAIRYDRSGTGPQGLAIFVSTNGGVFMPVFEDLAVSDLGEDQGAIDLTGYSGVTHAIFRLAAYGASSTAGTFDIENSSAFVAGESLGIVVFGSRSPDGPAVPEPGRALLGMLGLVAGVLVRRRHRS